MKKHWIFAALLLFQTLASTCSAQSAREKQPRVQSLAKAIRFSPDSQQLISAGATLDGFYNPRYFYKIDVSGNDIADRRLRLWDVKAQREIKKLAAQPISSTEPSYNTLLMPDFSTMLAAFWAYRVGIFQVDQFQLFPATPSIDVASGRIDSLDISPDGKIVAIGATRVVEFREAYTWKLLGNYYPGDQSTIVKFGPDSKTLICFWPSSSQPQAVDVQTFKQVVRPRWFYRIRDSQSARGYAPFAFSRDGKYVARTQKQTIEIWTTPTENSPGVKRQTFSSALIEIVTLQFSPDGKTLAVGGISSTRTPLEFFAISQ